MASVYLERRTDFGGKVEYWVYNRVRYRGDRPRKPLWQVSIFRQNHNSATAGNTGYQWIGCFLTSIVSKEDAAANWLVAGKNASYAAVGEASLRWTESGAGWGNATVGSDDGECSVCDSSKFRRSATEGDYAEFTHTVTAAQAGCSIELQTVSYSNHYVNWQLTMTKDGEAFTPNGRGLDTKEVRTGIFATCQKVRPWGANGIHNGDTMGTVMNYPMEIARNLEAGVYKVRMTNYVNTAGKYVAVSRVRLRLDETSKDIKPDDTNAQPYFAEFDSADGVYYARGPYLCASRSAQTIAMTKQGDSDWEGGVAHGRETQSAFTITVDGTDQSSISEGDVVAGDRVEIQTTGMLTDDDTNNLCQVVINYTITDDGLLMAPTMTWQQTTTIGTAYAGMMAIENGDGDGTIPVPYVPTQYSKNNGAFATFPPAASDDEIQVGRWVVKYGGIYSGVDGMDRWLVIENKPSEWANTGFLASTTMNLMETTGKVYARIANGASVTTGDVWGPMPTRIYYTDGFVDAPTGNAGTATLAPTGVTGNSGTHASSGSYAGAQGVHAK